MLTHCSDGDDQPPVSSAGHSVTWQPKTDKGKELDGLNRGDRTHLIKQSNTKLTNAITLKE